MEEVEVEVVGATTPFLAPPPAPPALPASAPAPAAPETAGDTTTSEDKDIVGDCIVCFDSISAEERAPQRCTHVVCKACMRQYLTVKITDSCAPFPRCPHTECQQAASDQLVLQCTDVKTTERMRYLRGLHPCRAKDGRRMWCVADGCYEPMPPPIVDVPPAQEQAAPAAPIATPARPSHGEMLATQLAQFERFAQVGGPHSRVVFPRPIGGGRQVVPARPRNDQGNGAAAAAPTPPTPPPTTDCAKCGTTACLGCGAAAHEGRCVAPVACLRQQRLYATYAVGRITACPHCGAHVERNGGCDQMMCARCRRPFTFRPFENVRQVQESLAFSAGTAVPPPPAREAGRRGLMARLLANRRDRREAAEAAAATGRLLDDVDAVTDAAQRTYHAQRARRGRARLYAERAAERERAVDRVRDREVAHIAQVQAARAAERARVRDRERETARQERERRFRADLAAANPGMVIPPVPPNVERGHRLRDPERAIPGFFDYLDEDMDIDDIDLIDLYPQPHEYRVPTYPRRRRSLREVQEEAAAITPRAPRAGPAYHPGAFAERRDAARTAAAAAAAAAAAHAAIDPTPRWDDVLWAPELYPRAAARRPSPFAAERAAARGANAYNADPIPRRANAYNADPIPRRANPHAEPVNRRFVNGDAVAVTEEQLYVRPAPGPSGADAADPATTPAAGTGAAAGAAGRARRRSYEIFDAAAAEAPPAIRRRTTLDGAHVTVRRRAGSAGSQTIADVDPEANDAVGSPAEASARAAHDADGAELARGGRARRLFFQRRNRGEL